MGDEIVLKLFEFGCYAWPLVFIVCCVYAKKSKGDGVEIFLFGLAWPMMWYFIMGFAPIALGFGIILGLYYLLIGRGKKEFG